MSDELTHLLQKLDENAARHAALNRYYAGEQPLTFLSPDVREQLNHRLDRVSVNVPRLLVDSIVERLRIVGFSRPDVWESWRANDLDELCAVAHREALVLGEAFAMVWARPDGAPLVTVESPQQVAAEVDPATRDLVRAVKRWETRDGTHAVMYGPEEIVRYRSRNPGATTTGFEVVERIENPLGVPPVVRFVNGGRLLEAGRSEMTDVLALTDAAVKLATDLLTASEYGARPRRWATGLELIEDDEGNVISPIAEDDRIMINESPEGKFGQLAGSDLAGYEASIGVVMRLISAVSGLPEHLLGIGGDNPTSADSIRASEAALTARAEAHQLSFGRHWEDVARLMVAVAEGVDPASVQVQIKWADAATRSVAQEADATVKLYAAGLLPASEALRRLGYSDEEIDRIRDARRAEALDGAGIDIAGLLS